MKQIPNIEESNSREIAGRVDDFYLQFCHEVNGKIKFDFDDAEIAIKWIQNNLQEMQATHHQQLQKAREEERERILGVECKSSSGVYYRGVQKLSIPTLTDHSPDRPLISERE